MQMTCLWIRILVAASKIIILYPFSFASCWLRGGGGAGGGGGGVFWRWTWCFVVMALVRKVWTFDESDRAQRDVTCPETVTQG